MVGRNDKVKGIQVLQDALHLLPEPIELHMVGDWPRWNAGMHKVVYHGVVRDQNLLMEKLDTCDVLLLPSLSEGMPTVILEAMARGLDVIASDVGAVRELVNNPLPPGDIKALAEAMNSAKEYFQPRRITDRFAWNGIARETVQILSNYDQWTPYITSNIFY